MVNHVSTKLTTVLSSLLLVACCATGSDKPASSGSDSSGATGSGAATTTVSEATTQYLIDQGIQKIFYDFDSSSLDASDRATLDRQAEWMTRNPSVVIQMGGNCDERGTREYNLALGDRRAAAAKSYLVSKGVDAARITTISYGKERPVCTDSVESCWRRNRNATTTVVSGASS